ncbi:tumor protein p53-inducible protein 13 isoform X1 [Protopterus annectens]|uniref:tumor protein p53-inducible protein 13 isoform X1 n=2 Tax=Protopterus annectens TaxID=7888 RepID=UPI001CF99660|nr:tumor protein p53-inducible protein 13 isoform X1 [Protopterus annectens]XP_043910388.1 tumor protein p53-inducible protein 13 isoform X1 [Protopterus annectens]
MLVVFFGVFRMCFGASLHSDSFCDNGQVNITVDLPGELDYTCMGPHWPLSEKVLPSIAKTYYEQKAKHLCMEERIVYNETIPNSGPHRPKWAKYGEYIYCPPQRWVHNLEHGGIAFLYHPCVHPRLKEELSLLARACMRKHVVTPYHNLSQEWPIALVAWGKTLEMSAVDLREAPTWLRRNVNRAYESDMKYDGTYNYLLIHESELVSDDNDKLVCPDKNIQMLKENFRRIAQHTMIRGTRRHQELYRPLQYATRGLLMRHKRAVTAGNKTKFSNESSVLNVSVSRGPGKVNQVLSDSGNASQGDNGQKPGTLYDQDDPLKNVFKEGQNELTSSSQHYSESATKMSANESTSLLRNVSRLQTQDFVGGTCICQKHQDVPSQSNLRPDHVHHAEAQRVGELHAHSSQDKKTVFGNVQYIRTPRTEEAAWAAASLTFLLVVLTLAVLYTKLYKGFKKSRSLYWTPDMDSHETITNIIKRRLRLGKKRKKKLRGCKKTVLYENLNNLSD